MYPDFNYRIVVCEKYFKDEIFLLKDYLILGNTFIKSDKEPRIPLHWKKFFMASLINWNMCGLRKAGVRLGSM